MSTVESLTHHKEALEERHFLLNKTINEMYDHFIDDITIHQLKKEKLHLRDEIELTQHKIDELSS